MSSTSSSYIASCSLGVPFAIASDPNSDTDADDRDLRMKIGDKIVVNCATPITVGRNYSIAPADLTITDNVVIK